MLAFIKGELVDVQTDYIVVENGNLGYEIRVPLSVINNLPPIGCDVKVYTYMYVREDMINLYGFLTRDDLAVFKLLITVSGIGPKGACALLSTITPDELRFAVMADDVKAITKAPGIGQKTAQKLIIELKDKLKLTDVFRDIDEPQLEITSSSNDIRTEAIQALVALGYSNSDAVKSIRQIEILEDMDVEDILKAALKKLAMI